MEFPRRDIFLKIEPLASYSPLAPIVCAGRYGRDCMFNPGHEYGRIPADEILASTLDALVYRRYLDPHYTIPDTTKLVDADVNEPPWDRRIPGCVLYAKPGERLYIHVLNGDPNDCHSFHVHGLRYGIDSDGAWPFGVASSSGSRSDEILPGQMWTYQFDVLPEMVGAWGFHDHVRDVGQNVNRGLFAGLIVRDPAAPCPDHQIPLFVHRLAGVSGETFESKRLSHNGTFDHTFATSGTVHYYCAIHGPSMNGTVNVVSGAPASVNVSIKDNLFDLQVISVAPGGTVHWRNDGNHDHIVFSSGGGATNFCLNGRAFIGNTPTIVGETGERLRWYVFNMDLGSVWHNFHPHSVRWTLSAPPGGASDVHGLSPVESFVTDTLVPPALRPPCVLEEFQCRAGPDACRVRLKGDFLFHCHVEEHMMAGLAGLVRARQYVWITDAIARQLDIVLPYDDDLNSCPNVDLLRCRRPSHSTPPADVPHQHDDSHVLSNPAAGGPAAAPAMPGMGGMPGMPASSIDVSQLASKGVWELLPCHAPLLPVHGAVLHTGKVLLFAGSGNDELYTTGLRSALWDFMSGEWLSPFTPVDFFCAGQSFLADGRLLVAGGTKEYDGGGHGFIGLESAYAFDPIAEQWVRLQSMTAGGRWYPTLVTLGDGRVFTVSGGPGQAEIYSSVTGWAASPPQGGWPLFPHLFLLENGHLFFDGGNVFANPIGTLPGVLNAATSAFTNVGLPGGFDPNQRDHCGSVLLPPAQDQKVMILGGGDPAINKVHIIDLKVSSPAYVAAASLHHARFHVNAVLLPDRTVLASGGNGQSESAPTAVLEAEIYHPTSNAWSLAAKAQVARMYHSIALLLPDGRVLAAGSNPNRRDDELRLEIFHPPYLFRGPRPIIESVLQEIQYGATLTIHTPNARDIKWVEIIWPMATTHSCETGQRIVDLPFKAENLCHLHAQVPKQPNLAPPGWYMLFLVNHAGIPSVAKWVHLTGGRRPKHDPAAIKEWIDMRMTGKERPVPGTEGMDRERHAPPRSSVKRAPRAATPPLRHRAAL
jgi:FtsP/CotA-like multicopper oxidase with cupredoxin domain